MPAHQLFQSPIYLPSLTHETSEAFGLGVPGDPMTFQTNFIGMLDHVRTHVDAFRQGSPNGATIDEMPLDMFMGKAMCFDLRQIGDLEDITAAHTEEPNANPVSRSTATSSSCARGSMPAAGAIASGSCGEIRA